MGCYFIDDKLELHTKIKDLVNHMDVFLISWGVSKCNYDFIPVILEILQVKKTVSQGIPTTR